MQTALFKENQTESFEVAIGIVARNEEAGIGATLQSLFEQSIFEELNRRGLKCEIVCLANGCTDRTPAVVAEIFETQMRQHPDRAAFRARVVELPAFGKLTAWNKFVHSISGDEARFLFLMDSDILIHRRESLWNMLCVLENDPEACIAVDRPRKDLAFKPRKTLWDHLSLAASRLTASADSQLCGQLYCIRAGVARNIYLPRDLAACEDGFIKTLVCTDFLTRPSDSRRVRVAEGAEHTFEAYTSPTAIIKNQKRQIIGQTIIHILLDGYLKAQAQADPALLMQTLKEKDRQDPDWLMRLIHEHLRAIRFFWWRLYPGMARAGFRRLKRLKGRDRVLYFPAAAASSLLVLFSGLLAFRALKAGSVHYWPQAQRRGFGLARAET